MREGKDGCRRRSTEDPGASVRRRGSLMLTLLCAKRTTVVERRLNRWVRGEEDKRVVNACCVIHGSSASEIGARYCTDADTHMRALRHGTFVWSNNTEVKEKQDHQATKWVQDKDSKRI